MGKRVIHSKSNNIEIMVGNENEVTEELIWSFPHMYFFFPSVFSFTNIHNSQDSRKRGSVSLFNSSVPF